MTPSNTARPRRAGLSGVLPVWLSLLAALWCAPAAHALDPIQPSAGDSCDPSQASCVPADCPTWKADLGLCKPASGGGDGGGGGGGTCTAPPGGSPTCGGSGPASSGGGGTGGVSVGAGNPINVISGNKYQEETDLAPLPGVLGLELKRYYNSLSSHAGIAGPQWRLSYETVLYDLGSQIQIVQADGRRLSFAKPQRQGAALCTSPQLADGQVRIERQPGGQPVYHWRWADGRTLSFMGGSGGGFPLQRISAPTGEQVLLRYNPLGDLVGVTDPQGRSLSLLYGRAAPGQRAALEGVDTPLGRIRYAHDKLGRLTEAAWLPREGSTLSRAPTATRLYHYEPAHQAGHAFALTGISLRTAGAPDQRLSTYAYDASGAAILTTRGRPQARDAQGQVVPDTGIEQLQLRYEARPGATEGTPQHSGEVRPRSFGRIVLTNALGQTTVLRSAVIGGQLRLIDSRGPGCSTCGPANVSYGYDREGRVIRTTQLSSEGQPLRSELHRYDAWGRLVETSAQAYTAGKPQAPQWTQRLAYRDRRFADGSIALGQQPVSIQQPSVVPGRTRSTEIEFNALGQVLRVTERGWSPIDEQGQDKPTAIERSTRYAYSTIAGKSLLTEIDGPLPNRPKGSPEDSDVTRFSWDAQGLRMTSMQQPGGRLNELSYEPSGRVAQVRNEAGTRTDFRYDATGSIAQLRTQGRGWPRAQIHSLQYDALGRLVEWGRGEVGTESYRGEQRQAYDVANRLVLRARASGVLEQFAYDAESRPISNLRQAGFMVQREDQEFDEQGRLTRMRGPQGRSLKLRYDQAGRPSLWIDALGREHHRGVPSAEAPQHLATLRDDWGRPVQTRSADAGATTRKFDAADRLVAAQDALGHRARYLYDAADRIVEQKILGAEGPVPLVTRWRYEGRRLVALEHPTQSERYTHDARGLLLTREVLRPGLRALTRYAYDDDGRLSSQSLPDGSLLLLRRDGLGQLIALERERVQTPWLRWLLPTQTLASEMKHDGVGLRQVQFGNGLVQSWERSAEGALARLVLRDPRQAERLTQAEAGRRFDRLMALLGVANAQAASPGTPAASAGASRPGALGLPPAPGARLDHRYLWDAQGNLLLDADHARASSRSYAYDARDRLVIEAAVSEGGPSFSSRWLFDVAGRRLLQQQGQPDPTELRAGTERVQYAAGTHRWLSAQAVAPSSSVSPPAPAGYDAQGQPQTLPDQTLRWDALGRLVALTDGHRGAQARYAYNHRGERIDKQVGRQRTQFLYEDRHLSAELDAEGRLQRQYVYLADLPLALLDTPRGQELADADRTVASDIRRIWQAWLGGAEQWAWLHANHLSAVELATDTAGHTLWQGQYDAHGALRASEGPLTMNLRLPGQYFDAESGLHFNHHRYYDPRRGEYLSPDPLGAPDGPNPYSYVRGNPLRYVDPDGLILFAFDGTGNTDNDRDLRALGNGISNIVKFRDLYEGGERHYITGVGTLHHDGIYPDIDPADYRWSNRCFFIPSAINADMACNASGPARIDRMVQYLRDESESELDDGKALDIDIVGFSRGAAQARDFANRIASASRGGIYRYTVNVDGKEQTHCQKLNFRFMGLFDTVLSTNRSGYSYQLGIPNEFAHVSHAVALNEYRGWTLRQLPDSVGSFPLESIMNGMASPVLPAGKTRTEMGFLGSHADIGGGFREDNELAKVSLAWMIVQARAAGVSMRQPNDADMVVLPNPVLHDKSDNQYCTSRADCSEDREVHYQGGATTKQRDMALSAGLDFPTIRDQNFISYYPPELDTDGNIRRRPRADFSTGTVDMKKYLGWLNENGYPLGGLHTQ